MHSKTLFKFLFNSSKISTKCAQDIFFLNTRPNCESNKIGSTQFGSTNWELQKSQISIQNCIFELAYWVWLTDNRDPLVRGPRLSAKQKQGTTRDGAEAALARRRRELRRGQWHWRAPSDDTHLPIPFPQPLPCSSYDGVDNGGRRRGRCGTPATASPHCPTQARYELHGVTTELER